MSDSEVMDHVLWCLTPFSLSPSTYIVKALMGHCAITTDITISSIMEFLLCQALNSLICISSAKQISAQTMIQLDRYGYFLSTLTTRKLRLKELRDLHKVIQLVNARARYWRRSLGGCDHWLTHKLDGDNWRPLPPSPILGM